MHAACSLESSSIACSLIPLLHLRTTGKVAQDNSVSELPGHAYAEEKAIMLKGKSLLCSGPVEASGITLWLPRL